MKDIKKNRREFFADSLKVGTTASILLNNPGTILADIGEMPQLNGRKPFILYLHMGSCCGISSGLAMPRAVGQWQKGVFNRDKIEGSANPLLNQHYQHGSLIFHQYNRMLADIANDVCLANGNSVSLDHNVAGLLQRQGTGSPNGSPQWPMGLAQFCKTEENISPTVISNASRTLSVPDINLIFTQSIDGFKTITSDHPSIPKNYYTPIWDNLKKRFAIEGVGSTKLPENMSKSFNNQLDILVNGLPAINSITDDITRLENALSTTAFNSIINYHPDKANITYQTAFKDQLVLAGSLALTGLANGMTIVDGGNDLHFGGADVDTARYAASKWALLTLFWKWCREQGLDNDVLIIVSHDFGRSPYNSYRSTVRQVRTSANTTEDVVAPGRDHALYFGMLFINKNVPSMGRIGNVLDNFVAGYSTNAQGGTNPNMAAHLSSHLVGSMLMRVFPEVFKTERMVRKHWPDFKEVLSILEAA